MHESAQNPSATHVLIVDDETSIRATLQAFLNGVGYRTDAASSVEQAQDLLACGNYDVVVSDVVLPRISGVALLRHIRETAPNVQVILITGEPTTATAAEAVRAGASDYLTKPVDKNAILRSVANAARLKTMDDERRRLAEQNAVYLLNLEHQVQERTRELEETLQNWKDATEGTILAMASAIESRDPYTAGHQQRVARLARAIAREMALPPDGIDAVYYAGLIHDIGKIGVPAEILAYPGRLSPEAMSLIKKHPQSGFHILEKVKFPWPIAHIILEHHERLNGTGYPEGLSGEQIRIESRILTVADVVEAMASHRPYRAALGIDAALAEIEGERGVAYDAHAVDACVKLFREDRFTFESSEAP